ncbi:hypothetical protein [Pseudomonas putida]
MTDQAQGLRRWAERQALQTLVVVGPPAVGGLAMANLQRWAAAGHAWVGDASRWRVLTVTACAAQVPDLARQHPRWGLWLGAGADDCRLAYVALRRLSQSGGPRRFLLLHDPCATRLDQVENLRRAAARFLGVQLLIVAESLQLNAETPMYPDSSIGRKATNRNGYSALTPAG